MDSVWRFTRGTNEVSTPVTAWRSLSFDDRGSRWSNGAAPFHYGEGLTGGTELTDMRNRYTCVYLRRAFVITNVAELDSLILDVDYDDGFIAWVNGTEIARALVTNTTYSSSASTTHEAGTIVSFTKSSPTFVLSGSNLLAIQAFNATANSSDFRLNAALRATYREQKRPEIGRH